MSQTYNLGKVAITPRGAYSSTAQYTPLDILSYNGSSYLVLQNCMGVTPPNATYYMVVASKGDTGSAGASPTIAAGTVTMTPAGTSASVTNVGTNVNASFNFTLPNGNVIYTGTGVTGTSTTPTVFSGSGVSNAGVGDIYFNTSTVAFYRCALGGNASTAKWAFLTYAVPDGSVTTAKIADSAISANKIADGSIGENKLSNGSVSLSKLASDVTTALNNKANVDGAYEQMTVGNAEQIVSTVGVSDNAPYNFRTSGGSADIGDRETETIVGGTIAWNQLASLSSSKWTLARASFSASGTTITLTATSSSSVKYMQFPLKTGHIYYVSGKLTAPAEATLAIGIYEGTTTNTYSFRKICDANSSLNVSFIAANPYESGNLRVQLATGAASGVSGTAEKLQVYDITAMLGSQIANYASTLESSAEGSGISWLKSYGLFAKSYYSYTDVSLLSVNTSSHTMVGFNAYNHSSGTARLVGGMAYQITGSYTSVSYITFDGGTETISINSEGIFTPHSNGTLTVTGGNATDTCVHLVWDGEKNGDYEEYEKHDYPLDSSIVLNGVPQLTSSNMYYYGDTYESDGTVKRYAVKVTLNGAESWSASTSDTTSASRYFFRTLGNYGDVVDNVTISDKYNVINGSSFGNSSSVGYTVFNSSARNKAVIYIRPSDNSISADAFMTLLSNDPVTVIYIVTNPTTTSAEPYSNPQIVSDWGTEEYVDYAYSQGTRDVQIPVGHNTLYSANLRAKLEMMPDSPSNGNGDYVVRQLDGINSYVPLVIPSELPTAPSLDGTYKLVCHVSDGVVEYAWSNME